jgi:hypothetical protein
MTDSLDKKVLAAQCEFKNQVMGIFGRRCAHTNARCAVVDSSPLSQCFIYAGHQVLIASTLSDDSVDHHEEYAGIGACDVGVSEYILAARMAEASKQSAQYQNGR